MHLAVVADGALGAVIDHGGVVIEPGGPALEQRTDQYDIEFGGQCRQAAAGRAVERLGQIEYRRVLVLTEIVAGMQLLEQHQLGALGREFADARFGLVEAFCLVGPGALLDQANGEGLGHAITPERQRLRRCQHRCRRRGWRRRQDEWRPGCPWATA